MEMKRLMLLNLKGIVHLIIIIYIRNLSKDLISLLLQIIMIKEHKTTFEIGKVLFDKNVMAIR